MIFVFKGKYIDHNMYTNVSDTDTTRTGEYRLSLSPRTGGLTQTTNGGQEGPVVIAAPGSAAVGAATVNSEWQAGGRWAWAQARGNKVKQPGQCEQQDRCKQWTANGQRPTAAAAGPALAAAAAAAAMANSEWQAGERWARAQARGNEVKQPGQHKQQDQCKWQMANSQRQQQKDQHQQWQGQGEQQGQSNGGNKQQTANGSSGSLPFFVLFFYLSEYEQQWVFPPVFCK